MFIELTAVRSVTLCSIFMRVVLSLLLGGLLGMERGMKKHPAGLRTYILVCLGACIVMTTNQYVHQAYGGLGDPVRMGAQVVSGIGFLGAGTIIVTARNQIRGLTTAAGLWAAACMGLAIGIGFYELAVIGGIAIFAVLTVLHRVDGRMRTNAKLTEMYIELKSGVPLGVFFRYMDEHSVEVRDVQLEMGKSSAKETVAFGTILKKKSFRGREEILKEIRDANFIEYFKEL